MHGKVFLLRAIYAGVDELNLYGRLDFSESASATTCQLAVSLEYHPALPTESLRALRLDANIHAGKLAGWSLAAVGREAPFADSTQDQSAVKVAVQRSFEFKLPLVLLDAASGGKIRLRFSLWQNRLPVDALPAEGWLELALVDEGQMLALNP
jgi:hypothetical protein